MECPKCGMEIDDKAMVCPNCKKVLRLSCPICKTINTANVCKSCGYTIMSKCHKCGKLNQTITKKCKKCGFPTEKSVIMNDANTDDYALITIEFPNMRDMKNLLGSAKSYNRFKQNVDKIILNYTKSIGLKRQITDGKYIIRCTRDYTLNSSVATAIRTVIELLTQITTMNWKLTKKKDANIKSNVFIQKRNVDDDPNNIDFAYNINMLSQEKKSKEEKVLETFQVLADAEISNILMADYKVSPLNSVLSGDEMVMIYEIDLRNLIKIDIQEEDENDEITIPNFVQNMLVEQDKLDGEALQSMNEKIKDQDAIYDVNTIRFDEVKCEFIRTENIDVSFHVMNKLQSCPKGILAIKTPEMYKPYTLKILNAAAETGSYNNIITLTCYDEMKYSPYSFFRDLVSAIFEYTVSQKLFLENDFSMFANVDPDGLIRDLITLQKRDTENPEGTRYIYYDIFLTLLQVIPKTLIYVEDFEKIDSSSYDVLQYLFQSFEDLDISFLISYDKEFSLHKDCHFLLMKPYYTEISLKATSFEKMIENNKVYYKNILNDFYFQRIAKYACGSSLFIDIALQYLIESGVYDANEETVEMINPKTIIIPSNLDKLVERRLNLLQDDADTMKFLTSIVLLGTRIDMNTIASLEYKDSDKIIEKLSNMGYVYEYNNCLYFPNYNLLRRNLLSSISKIYLNEVANELFEKVYNGADMPSPEEAYLYGLLGDIEKERQEWEELAEVDLSLGDFNAFINCTGKIINLLNKDTNPENANINEQKKAELYKRIAENLYDYIPKSSFHIADDTLNHIEKFSDTDKIIQLCNKMINGAIISQDYNYSLELMHKVLSMLPKSSINPQDENFNAYFFLMSAIHVQILFNIGALSDCIDIGYKVLNVVTDETIPFLKPDYFDDEKFKVLMIDTAGYVALASVILMTGTVGEFLNIIRNNISGVPQSYDLFVTMEELLKGNFVSNTDIEIADNDKFGWAFINIIRAFNENLGDYKIFAEYIYKAKIAAKSTGIYPIELFTDLMIAYAYLKVKSYEKAEHITYSIIRHTSNNGMTAILYLAWFIMSEIQLKQKNYDVAFGIVNNTLIQIEKNNNTSEYILMLFKYNMFKILMYKQEYNNAEICVSHAKYISDKYGINFEFDIDPAHYTPEAEAFEDDFLIERNEEIQSTQTHIDVQSDASDIENDDFFLKTDNTTNTNNEQQ